jgi:hypothetical protein
MLQNVPSVVKEAGFRRDIKRELPCAPSMIYLKMDLCSGFLTKDNKGDRLVFLKSYLAGNVNLSGCSIISSVRSISRSGQ